MDSKWNIKEFFLEALILAGRDHARNLKCVEALKSNALMLARLTQNEKIGMVNKT